MSAAARPLMRRELRYIRQVQAGKVVWVVKDPVSLRYFRFGETEAWLMQRMDGSRSFDSLSQEAEAELGKRVSMPGLETFFRRMRELGLARRTPEEERLQLMERVRAQRGSWSSGNGNTLLRMRFPFGDPDRLLDGMLRRMRFLFTRPFVAFSLLFFGFYAIVLVTHWPALLEGMGMLYRPESYTLGFAIMLYVSLATVCVIHEFGHGLTCKAYGGEVHEIGAMLMYFSPAFFCNVNDAWSFERRSHRLWVTFAGIWTDLLLASSAAVIWLFSEPGTVVNTGALLVLILAGGLGILTNMNPLLPFDGYYALMDWLEIPNLRARSFQYVSSTFKRRVLRMQVPPVSATPREARIFIAYGVLAILYSTFVLGVVAFFLGRLAVGKLGGWGWALILLVGWRMTSSLRRGGLRNWRALLQEWQLRFRRYGSRGLGFALGLLLLVAFFPWTVRAPGTALLESTERVWLRAPEDARVAALHVREGDAVRAGQVLAVLESPELQSRLTEALATLRGLEREAAAAAASGDLGRESALRLARGRAETDVLELQRRAGNLVLRAPMDGAVVTPRLEETVGRQLASGDSLLAVFGAAGLQARVLLRERDAGDLAVGTRAGLRFPAAPGVTWRGDVTAVAPAAREGYVEALVPVSAQGAEHGLRAGMTGSAKFALYRTHAGNVLLRAARRTIKLEWLL